MRDLREHTPVFLIGILIGEPDHEVHIERVELLLQFVRNIREKVVFDVGNDVSYSVWLRRLQGRSQ